MKREEELYWKAVVLRAYINGRLHHLLQYDEGDLGEGDLAELNLLADIKTYLEDNIINE